MPDTELRRTIPYYVIESALKNAKDHDEYAIVRSDNDYQYARTLDEANTIAHEMRSETETISPLNHSVQVVGLQENPPATGEMEAEQTK